MWVPRRRKALTSLVPCVMGASFFVDSAKAGKVLEGVAADTFGAMVRDAMGSHIVEVIVQVGGHRQSSGMSSGVM